MEKMLTVAVLVVALSVSVAAQDKKDLKMNASSTYVSLNAKGTATISKQSAISNDANKIVAKILKLEEISSNGSLLNTMDPSTLNLRTILPPVQDADALSITASSSNFNSGAFTTVFDIFTKNKQVVIDGENTEVKAGDIGIKFLLSEYTFSKDDNKLKMTLMIKGKSVPTEITTNKGTDGLAYDLGGNGVLKLSKKVKLGNVFTNVFTNVKVTVKEDKFTIEFTKGNPLIYAISIKPADVSSDGITKSTSLGVAMMAILMLLHTVY